MLDLIDKYESGISCPNCWGPGKTFGDVPGPKRIRLTASGFVGACAVCNGTFILEQTVLLPCIYYLDDGSTVAEVIFGVANTQFTMEISGGANCYLQVEGLCALSSNFGAVTIEIKIDEPFTPAWKIAFEQNFSSEADTRHAHYKPVNSKEVVFLFDTSSSVKLHVKHTPDY